jgi:hypothetical protein
MSDKKSHGTNRMQHQAAKAQHKKLFVQHLREICKAAGAEDAFDLIPAKGIDHIYRMRGTPLQIIPAAGQQIPPETLRLARALLLRTMDQYTYSLSDHGPLLPLSYFYTVGFSFYSYLYSLSNHPFPQSERLQQLFHEYILQFGGYERAEHDLSMYVDILVASLADLQNSLYGLTYHLTPAAKEAGYGFDNILQLHRETPAQTHVVLDGIARPIVRLGWGALKIGIGYLTIRPQHLGLPDDGTETPFEVYFQSHALQRLHERIDCLRSPFTLWNLIMSVRLFRLQRMDDGTILLEYTFFGERVGYFVIEVHDRMVILRTFLFLTNDGTPEGKQLRSLYGLQRRDTNYLSIDKLSGFISEDLYSTKEIHSVLQVLGCQKLGGILNELNIALTKPRNQHAGEFLARYLGLKPENDFLSTITSHPEINKTPPILLEVPETLHAMEESAA